MEIGIQAEKCSCIEVCKRGVEPLNDCVCRLPGETVTAKCDVCGGTTWHNNGSCIACVRKVREEAKQKAAARHAQILAAPPQLIDISKIYPEFPAPAPKPLFQSVPVPQGAQIVLHVNDMTIVIADTAESITRILKAAIRG